MTNEELLKMLTEISPEEQKALDYIKVYGVKPSGVELIKIFNLNLSDYYSQSIISEYFRTKSKALIPNHILLNENICFPENLNIDLSKSERYVEMFPHMHDFFEIEYVLSGSCTHVVEQQKFFLKKGDIVIVPPKVVHTAIPDDESIVINLKIRRSTFDKVFFNFLNANTVLSSYFSRTLYSKAFRSSMTFHCDSDDTVKGLILKMYNQVLEKKMFSSYMLEGMTITLFSYLVQNYSENVEISNMIITSDDRMNDILSYINKNYKTVTLASAAEKFYISQQYLSTLIKKETGSTFTNILKEIKLNHAAALLVTTDIKIDDICDESGYNDTTQFIKTFKKYYGVTPKQYRNKHKNKNLQTEMQ